MMLRSILAYKPVLALATALALGSLSPATGAVAARYSHHGGLRAGTGIHSVRAHPGFAARSRQVYRWAYHRPYAHRYSYRHGFRVSPRYYPYYGYYDGCYRWRWVATPWGWRFRRLNVCYPNVW
jgi:hypothetical protein